MGVKSHPELALVGQRISELRAKAGFSQESFAYELGMDRAYYGGLERGQRNVAMLNLIRVARGLSVEVGELFPAMSALNAPKQAKPAVKRGRPKKQK